MRIIFAIPTWNRCEQLNITVRLLVKEILLSGIEALIVISDNCSDDSTQSVIEDLENEFNFISSTKLKYKVSALINMHNVLSLALEISCSNDYIWMFGDDDDLNDNILHRVQEIMCAQKPFFLSAGNSRLGPHTNKNYQAGMTDLTQNFSFFLTSSFISQCIFSHELASEIVDKNFLSEKFSNDAYAHGTSILYLGHNKKCIYVDSPICSYRIYQKQAEDTRVRWSTDNVYLNLFNFINSLELLIEEKMLPPKLEKSFFRYWNFHFWDFLLYEATIMALQNPSSINGEHWNKLSRLCGFLKDRELAKRIEINLNLQRMILSHGVKPEIIMNLTNKYTFWGGAVYDLPVVTHNLLLSLQSRNS
jgi:glycosyltransferase involved in cell wall biosynthesis